MSFHPEKIKLTGAQAAGLLIMVLLVVFPPVMVFWSHLNFGPNPLLTLTLVGAVGGCVTSLLCNWPHDKHLSAMAGALSGAGAQVAVIALGHWSHEMISLKVVVFMALIMGAAPGYVLYRWRKLLIH